MSDSTTKQETTETPGEGEQVQAPEQGESGTGTEEQPQEGAEGDGQSGEEEEPPSVDHLQRELRRTRNEAAARRTRVQELEAQLTEAKTPEQFQEAVADYQAKIAELERNALVAEVGKDLPDALRALLKGETREELEAHAATLAEFAPKKQGGSGGSLDDLSGGVNPGDGRIDEDEVSPADAAAYARRRRF